jgi:signal transduction histidine kinase
VEAGKLRLSESVVDLNAVIKSVVRLVEERARAGGLKLITEIATDLPRLYADERKLKQILINLLSNAVKFTPAGGSIMVGAELAQDGAVLVSVTDTGIGIAPEDIETALAPFGQIEASLARNADGTGLGLPLSRAMAELHGGDLMIDSAINRGTTVVVRLPSSRAVHAPAATSG